MARSRKYSGILRSADLKVCHAARIALLKRLGYKSHRLHKRDDPEPDRWHEDRRKKVHHGDLFHLKDAKAGCQNQKPADDGYLGHQLGS